MESPRSHSYPDQIELEEEEFFQTLALYSFIALLEHIYCPVSFPRGAGVLNFPMKHSGTIDSYPVRFR